MERFDDYQAWTDSTAQYPGVGGGGLDALGFLGLGLAGESGEAVEKIKKLIRNGDTPELRAELAKELGDVMWYIARPGQELGVPMSALAAKNVAKLEDRLGRGVIKSAGDNR